MTHRSFDGRVALVTGGARGIGRAIVHALVGQGCRVLVTDLKEEEGQELAGSLGSSVRFMASDHTRMADNLAAVAMVMREFNQLHLLFNNAGVACPGAIGELNARQVQRAVDVNLVGPVLMTQAALPALRATVGDRCIVFTGSIQSLMVRPNFSVYGATKHGVAGLVGSLALELAEEGIRVNGLCPGPVDTDVFRDSVRDPAVTEEAMLKLRVAGIPIKRMIEAREVADAALFLASGAASAITGAMLPVDGGITAR